MKNKIENLTYVQLKNLSKKLELKGYTKYKSKEKLIEFIKRNKSDKEIKLQLVPSWWKVNFNNIGVWATLLGTLLTVVSFFLIQISQKNSIENSSTFQPIFNQDDSTRFKILILPFEDIINGDETNCIGLSVLEHINAFQLKKELPIAIEGYYADDMHPARSMKEAKEVQKKHNADLIIYGRASQLNDECEDADICFRYNISEEVVQQLPSVIKIKTAKHDLEHVSSSPANIESGNFQIDAVSMNHWISALVNVKANNWEEAFLELDEIGTDPNLSNTKKSSRYTFIGDTYRRLQQYNRAIKAYRKAIELNPNNSIAYTNFSYLIQKTKKYNNLNEIFEEYKIALNINPHDPICQLNVGYMYIYKSDFDSASVYLQNSLNLYPNFCNQLGLSYISRLSGKIEQTIKSHDNLLFKIIEDEKRGQFNPIFYGGEIMLNYFPLSHNDILTSKEFIVLNTISQRKALLELELCIDYALLGEFGKAEKYYQKGIGNLIDKEYLHYFRNQVRFLKNHKNIKIDSNDWLIQKFA